MVHNVVFASHGELQRFLLCSAILSCSPTASSAVILGWQIYHHHFKQTHFIFFLFSKLNDTDWTSGFRNIINISITPLLWSFGQLQKNRKSFESLRFNCHISQTCFPSTACVIFPPFALVSAICSSRWCQYCDWERGNCGRESFHHYKRYRSEDGWCGRRNVWTLLRGAQHHVPGAQWPAHCRQQPYWRIAKSGELNHINQP